MRADQLLVAQGLAPTRSAAQRLIGNGAAEWASPTGWTALKKAGEDLHETAQLRVTDDAELRYVSRTPDSWHVLVRRNYPRGERHAMAAPAIPARTAFE